MIEGKDIVAHYSDLRTGAEYSVRFTPLKVACCKVDVYENGHVIGYREEFWGAPSLQTGKYILEEALNRRSLRPHQRISAKHESVRTDMDRGTSWATRVPVSMLNHKPYAP